MLSIVTAATSPAKTETKKKHLSAFVTIGLVFSLPEAVEAT